MRVLSAFFLTLMAIHSNAPLINAQESSILYVQIVAADFGEENHNISQLSYRAFRSQDDCENDLIKGIKNGNHHDLEGGKAEYLHQNLVVLNYGGFVKIRCVKIFTNR